MGNLKTILKYLQILQKKMGIEEKFTEGKSQDDWQEWIYKQTFDLSLIHI